ncbi:hypothetical protein BOVMAS02_14640 [Streptococcus uberis]
MDKIEMISFSILLDEVAESRQLLENLVSLEKTVYSEISVGVIPFISSLSDGIIKFLPTEVHSDFPSIGEQEFQKIISSVRVSYKQYTDKKFNKATKLILEIEKRFYSQMVLFQKLISNIFAQHDLGVYYFRGMPYANTNQYHIYLESILSKTDKNEIPYFDNRATELFFEYSKGLGTLINSVNQKAIAEPLIEDIKISDFKRRDFYLLDSSRRNFLNGNLPLETQLFLFNILCQNNFVMHVMPRVLNSKKYFFTRSLIQCYLVSIKALRSLFNKYGSLFSVSQLQITSDILNRKEKYFKLGQDFRNNIFHYKISNVPIQNFTTPEYFFEELIEFHSSKKFKDYQKLLLLELPKINELIESLIN